jgi:protein tyrosine phosphatase
MQTPEEEHKEIMKEVHRMRDRMLEILEEYKSKNIPAIQKFEQFDLINKKLDEMDEISKKPHLKLVK